MSVDLKYKMVAEAQETLALGLDNVENPVVAHKLGDFAATLTASSTPAVTKVFSDTIALAAGTAAIDLAALAGPMSTTVDFTGLKVQIIQLACPTGNTGGITVAKTDVVTGYNLFGADNASAEQVEVLPGTRTQLFHRNTLEDVDATHKDITFTGTGTDTIQVLLAAG
jgi:hypothetical protein